MSASQEQFPRTLCSKSVGHFVPNSLRWWLFIKRWEVAVSPPRLKFSTFNPLLYLSLLPQSPGCPHWEGVAHARVLPVTWSTLLDGCGDNLTSKVEFIIGNNDGWPSPALWAFPQPVFDDRYPESHRLKLRSKASTGCSWNYRPSHYSSLPRSVDGNLSPKCCKFQVLLLENVS